ncbi:MAG: amidohydrolase [Hornefia sp.]|nr:amidohydrolase [Hornefia sp.]
MLFKNITIIDENFDVKENKYVGTIKDKIAYIGDEMPQNSSEYGKVYQGKGKLLMPGFYNAHAHSPMALMRGYGENMVLQDWLTKRIFPFEAKLTGDAVYWGTMLCMAESLRFGIVSTSDMYYFISDMVRAVSDIGGKNNISRSVVNFDGTSFSELDSTKELISAYENFNNIENQRIKIEASLHAEYTSDETTVKELALLAKKYGMSMQVHVSETRQEHEECKQRHGGKTPVKYLYDCGLFDVPAVAAHCVHIEDEDFAILKEKNVTVATNPVSNLKLASGIADTGKMLAKGINLAIGTDSVASNNSLNFIEEMKMLAVASKVRSMDPTAVTPKEVVYAATRGGALAQGRDDCGLLKTGMKADLVIMDIQKLYWHPIHDLLNNLVYSASGSDVELTMVDGKVLYNNGEYATIDEEKVIFEVESRTKEILAKL